MMESDSGMLVSSVMEEELLGSVSLSRSETQRIRESENQRIRESENQRSESESHYQVHHHRRSKYRTDMMIFVII